ncbi:MAG: hypothetical protein KC731_13750 [Myxococcales bacterium]|nr:hypothetical protein [Myxococcales bacterium]
MLRLEMYSANGRDVYLREVTAADVLGVSSMDTRAAIDLLDGLIVPAADGSNGLTAFDLCATDRERWLAEVWMALVGPRIAATHHCESCGEPFDADFDLRTLLDFAMTPAPLVDGAVDVDGCEVRIPCGRDELWLAQQPAERPLGEALASRLAPTLPERLWPSALAALQPYMQVVEQALDLTCPECSAATCLTFDLQPYVLSGLMGRQAKVLGEVHALARSYHWSLAEICALPTRHRRRLLGFLEREAAR